MATEDPGCQYHCLQWPQRACQVRFLTYGGGPRQRLDLYIAKGAVVRGDENRALPPSAVGGHQARDRHQRACKQNRHNHT